MITPDQVIAEAREWLGTPFHHQGRQKGVGVDCVGLPVGALLNLGITTPDMKGYAREPDGTLERVLNAKLDKIPLQPGALILFRIRRNPQHVAIATDHGIIHSYSGAGKVVETCLDERWRVRIIDIYALPGVAYVG